MFLNRNAGLEKLKLSPNSLSIDVSEDAPFEMCWQEVKLSYYQSKRLMKSAQLEARRFNSLLQQMKMLTQNADDDTTNATMRN